MYKLTFLSVLFSLVVPVLPGQTWNVELLPSQGASANHVTADHEGIYLPGTYVYTNATVEPLDTGGKGKPVYTDRSSFNFSVRNPFPRSSGGLRTIQFSGIEIDLAHSPGVWNDPHACLYPTATSSSTFPTCLAEFMNGYNSGKHPGFHYGAAGLWVYLRDVNFLLLPEGASRTINTPTTARVNIAEPSDCTDPINAGIGFMMAAEFPSGLSGTATVTRTGRDTWRVDVNQPLAMNVFLMDRTAARNKTSCQIVSSGGAGPVWTKPVRFSMVWTRTY